MKSNKTIRICKASFSLIGLKFASKHTDVNKMLINVQYFLSHARRRNLPGNPQGCLLSFYCEKKKLVQKTLRLLFTFFLCLSFSLSCWLSFLLLSSLHCPPLTLDNGHCDRLDRVQIEITKSLIKRGDRRGNRGLNEKLNKALTWTNIQVQNFTAFDWNDLIMFHFSIFEHLVDKHKNQLGQAILATTHKMCYLGEIRKETRNLSVYPCYNWTINTRQKPKI